MNVSLVSPKIVLSTISHLRDTVGDTAGCDDGINVGFDDGINVG
jgi:hypothetical protein